MPTSPARQQPLALPKRSVPRIRQSASPLKTAQLDQIEHLLVVIPETPAKSLWRNLPAGEQLKKLASQRKLTTSILQTRLGNKAATGISLQQLPGSGKGTRQPAAFELLNFAGQLAADGLRDNPGKVAIHVAGFSAAATAAIQRALLLALAAHNFELPTFKSGKQPAQRLKTIELLGAESRLDTHSVLAEAAGNNLARWLTCLPPNKLDAGAYKKLLRNLARQHDWKMEFYGEPKLRTLGAGAFLAVSQGNATRDAGIVRLCYNPQSAGRKSTPALALIGKGILFDTGGTNLKPFKAMLDMHTDMAGSATAVATLAALTELKFPHPVECWLAITENRMSNTAYKSRDVVQAANGTTIEVIHTDAEGRMALADTLALAGRHKPKVMIDFATLTGTCVSALTERYSGAFSNDESLHAGIIAAGKTSGERVWPFPMDEDFDDEIKSQVADVLQCAEAGGGDHIQAARFLQRFVPKNSQWIHLDLSAATRKGGLAQVPTEITGFGVRYALELITGHLPALATKGRGKAT